MRGKNDTVPEKPVKFTLLYTPCSDKVSVPALTFNVMLLPSDSVPKLKVRVPAPPLGAFTTRLPVVVKPVEVDPLQSVPEVAVSVSWPDAPKLIDRVFAFELLNVVLLSVYGASERLPSVNVNVLEVVRLAPRSSVTVLLLRVHVVQTAPVAVVQVPVPLLASNVTVSAATGADAPDAPPDVADQLAVELAFHVPEPPTQNLAAMSGSYG